jgi:2,3-bisphosphoglycerate-dependent phosphoglycerate mutase
MPSMRRSHFYLLLLFVFVCSDRIPATAEPAQMMKPAAPLAPVKTQATLIIVRHAEKAGPTGDVPLTDAGHARAAALAHVLRDANISTIFVTDLQRTQQTAAPIAKALNLTPVVVPAADVAGLAAKLAALPAGTTALVVNHNPSVLQLATAFGAKDVASMEETEYDRMMILTPGAPGKSVLLTLRYGAASNQ